MTSLERSADRSERRALSAELHRPWGHTPEHDVVFPPAEELALEIGVEPAEWCSVFLGRGEREAKGPNGEIATVADNIVALRRTIYASATLPLSSVAPFALREASALVVLPG